MNDTEYVNPIQLAQQNVEEANRQLAEAEKHFRAGDITEARLEQLRELKDIAVADLARVIKEN
ncbi:hypothetical protein [Specibacter cremeus]|uniref:hypothetical protein n=1 Tax=Specibacter cremeus TaxID=1629051 RepID=UPI000F7B63FD|nr:hypothetical protein [Specibacter cremeus]